MSTAQTGKNPPSSTPKSQPERKKKKKSYLDFNYSYWNLDSSKLIAQLQDGTVSTGWRRKLILPGKRPLVAVWSRNLLFGMQRMLCNHGHMIKRASLSSVAVNDDLLHDCDENGPRYRGTTHRFIRLTLSLSFSTSHGIRNIVYHHTRFTNKDHAPDMGKLRPGGGGLIRSVQF